MGICRNCGRSHNAPAKCPGHGQTCLYCKKLKHFAEVCQFKARKQRIHATEDQRDSAAEISFEFIGFESVTKANLTHETQESSRDEIFVSVQVNLAKSDNRKTTLRAKLDNNGKLKHNTLLSTNVVLNVNEGSQMKHHGTVTIPCTYGKESALDPLTSLTSQVLLSLAC